MKITGTCLLTYHNKYPIHIGDDCGGILGDAAGNSGTVRTDCSVATLATTKAYLEPPINYLLVPPVILNQPSASAVTLSLSQAVDQPPSQALNQPNHQPARQPTSQSKHPDNSDPTLLQQTLSPTAPSSSIPTSSSSSILTDKGPGSPPATSSAVPSSATAAANNRLQDSSDG